MKKNLVCALALVLILGGCDFWKPSEERVPEKILGSGNVVEEQRQVNGFSRVSLQGMGTLKINLGNEELLLVRAEDNLLPHLKTEVKNGTLTIRSAEEIEPHPTEPLEFHVTAKELENISLSGTGIVETSELRADEFTINLAGAADADIAGLVCESLEVRIAGSGIVRFGSLDAESIEARISGTGNMSIDNGTAEEQEVAISGTGTYEAEDLQSVRAEVHLSGTAAAVLRVSDHLEANMSGACLVKHFGDPEIEANIDGTSIVERVDEY